MCYRKMDCKAYIKQITHIERRKARIHKIRAQNALKPQCAVEDDTATSPDPKLHHIIEKTENFSEDVGYFVQQQGGSCVQGTRVLFNNIFILDSQQDFISKLKKHLLSHIKAALMQEGVSLDLSTPDNWASIQFKWNCIFKHKTMRINFTTYDVH